MYRSAIQVLAVCLYRIFPKSPCRPQVRRGSAAARPTFPPGGLRRLSRPGGYGATPRAAPERDAAQHAAPHGNTRGMCCVMYRALRCAARTAAHDMVHVLMSYPADMARILISYPAARGIPVRYPPPKKIPPPVTSPRHVIQITSSRHVIQVTSSPVTSPQSPHPQSRHLVTSPSSSRSRHPSHVTAVTAPCRGPDSAGSRGPCSRAICVVARRERERERRKERERARDRDRVRERRERYLSDI